MHESRDHVSDSSNDRLCKEVMLLAFKDQSDDSIVFDLQGSRSKRVPLTMWCESSLCESNVAAIRLIGLACIAAALIEAIAKCLCDLRVVISSTKSGTKLSRKIVYLCYP